ncbi:unnamed protein product, partial [Rotaria sp. Silwood1]
KDHHKKNLALNLHLHNAKPCMQNINLNLDYLQEEKIKVMAHPPYSPDFAPSDLWLFNRLKRSLDTYPVSTSLATATTKELNSIPIHEYQKTFQKCIEMMKFCIEHRGDCF